MFAEPMRHQHSSIRTYVGSSSGYVGQVPMEEMHYISVKHSQYQKNIENEIEYTQER